MELSSSLIRKDLATQSVAARRGRARRTPRRFRPTVTQLIAVPRRRAAAPARC